MNRQPFVAVFAILTALAALTTVAAEDSRPNILFAIADDWGWPHAGAYGDPVVKTPTFDRIAREGLLFHHAYVSSPSCTPSRGAILTGQFHWRLAGAANLWSVFPDKFVTYPELLKHAGYEVGVSSKGWGPGKTETPGRELVGKRYKDFQEFLARRDTTKPFCYWLGSSDPHRDFKLGSGAASGMDLSRIKLPAGFPDHETVRGDVADYYVEVGNWFADTDNGPTKTYMVEYRDKDDTHRRLFDLAFAKRPAEELYDLSLDPDQLENVVGESAYGEIKDTLAEQLDAKLRAMGDPRVIGGVEFDKFPYLGGGPKHPDWEAIDRKDNQSPTQNR